MIGEFVGGMLTEIAAGIVQGLADEGISKIKDALSPTYKNPTVPPKAVKAKHAKPEKKPYVSRDKRHERNLKKKLDLQKRRAITNSEGA
jgi:hypothetical protein